MRRTFFSAVRMAFVCAAMAAAAPAHAQRWVQVAQGADGGSVEMDPQRITRRGNQLETWLRFTYPTVQRTRSGAAYRSYLMRMELDCGLPRWRPLQSVFYDASGREVSREAGGGAWEAVIPQSVMEIASGPLCGRTPRAAAAVPAMRFGALAARRSGTAWSVDYPTQAQADQRALSECGAGCRVVVHIAGPQCGAYATSPSAAGSALAPTRAQAEADALANCEHARRGGRPCAVAVWACNGRG